MNNNYLVAEELSCGYGNKFNLQQISFSVKRRAFAGIIGPNGSGKSTLFKGLSGLLPVKGGNLILDNDDLSKIKTNIKAQKIAVVSQFPDDVDIPVKDYVLMGRLPYRKTFHFFETDKDTALANEFMELTGIYHLREKSMIQLSGGEQQLAAIAQALTQEPELLLLDEPTSHLDITHQVKILNLIKRLNNQTDLTVLMIIHDLNLAAEYCDYLIMMNNGKIHTKGSPVEVLTYKNIEDVYNTVVVTQNNPVSGKPVIFLVSENIINKKG